MINWQLRHRFALHPKMFSYIISVQGIRKIIPAPLTTPMIVLVPRLSCTRDLALQAQRSPHTRRFLFISGVLQYPVLSYKSNITTDNSEVEIMFLYIKRQEATRNIKKLPENKDTHNKRQEAIFGDSTARLLQRPVCHCLPNTSVTANGSSKLSMVLQPVVSISLAKDCLPL